MLSLELPFPRAVNTFVGRHEELGRIIELIEREPLFLVCGIAGVGKSELVFKSIELARERPRWRDVRPILIRADPGLEVDELVAQLRARLTDTTSRGGDELPALARSLEERPSFVFLDDAHHIDPASLSQALAYLSRHVVASRLFVASRWEIPIPPTAAPPVVIRVGCLGPEETGQMVALLAERLGIDVQDPTQIFQRSRGSPFFVQRELVAAATSDKPATDSIADSMHELSDAERSVLLSASLLRGRVALDDLRNVVANEVDQLDAVLASLRRRFLIDVDRAVVVVHDLIRDVSIKQATEDELHAARRAAARLHLERFAADLKRVPLDVIEALRHLIAAGDYQDAWQLIERWYRRIAAAGLDHLLLSELRTLRHLFPAEEIAIELLEARILIRRSLIADAEVVLRRIGRRPQAATSFRYLFLSGEVALRTGRVESAEELFGRATSVAREATDRFQAALERASVASLRGDTTRASQLLDTAITDLAYPSARHRGRWSWARAANFALAGRFAPAAAAAREGAAAVKGQGLEDLLGRLAVLEVIALVQCDQIAAAKALADQIPVDLTAGAVREHLTLLGRGAVLHGEGDMRSALVALSSAYDHFDEHGDLVNACIAGFHLAVAHAALGDIERSTSAVLRAISTARSLNAFMFVPHGMAFHARLCVAANDLDTAREVAMAARAESRDSARTQVTANSVLALIESLCGGDPVHALDRAASCLQQGADGSLAFALALDRAEIALLTANPEDAIVHGERARKHYAQAGRRYEEARATAILAVARAAGGDADRVLAEKAVARTIELTDGYGYRSIRTRVALAQAALDTNSETSRARLVETFREQSGSSDELETTIMRAALDRHADAPPGLRELLRMLGFHRTAVDPVVAQFDLVVDVTRGLLIGGQGGKTIKGRPITCKVIAVLVEVQGAIVTPETLYRRAWEADDYHPLRHRNTLYVAVNRARRALRELFPDADLIENVPGGWRLSERIKARCLQ